MNQVDVVNSELWVLRACLAGGIDFTQICAVFKSHLYPGRYTQGMTKCYYTTHIKIHLEIVKAR